MDIQYTGELLLPGQLGHLFLIISFVASVIALVSYFFGTTTPEGIAKNNWRRIGNFSFIIHSVAVLAVLGFMYYLIFEHRFEYDYVRRHTAEAMPFKYLISAFWSGQQGSFMLWIFWNAVLGLTIMASAKKIWSVPVLAVFALAQAILTSMLLGIYMNRGIALLLLFLFLNIPLWMLLRREGVKGWKSLVPILNLVAVHKTAAHKNTKGLMYFLALPVNLIIFVLLPLQFADFLDYISNTIRIGVSPFVLARTEFSSNAIFLFPDYVKQIEGKGLNPLLENNWMVIHPPVLFLGFASTIIPFAFAIAGMANKLYGEWIKPALPWTIFSGMILGTGIMLGGMWAYEALSFGGFWAWDPVENASLVPWITLVAGMHTMLAYKHSGHALKITYILFFASFFLILYSTFLTRSGILGSSSVHSFTDLGMMGQLIILILAMMIPAIIMLWADWKKIPSPEKEENTYSREFWMFIGSLVLLISAIQITFSTSTPVFNSILGSLNNAFGLGFKDNYAMPEDAVAFYNSIQVWLGIAIALLSGAVQYFRYRHTKISRFVKNIVPALLISLVLTGLMEYFYRFDSVAYLLLLFTGLFAVIANLQYMLVVVKAKWKFSGASVAHIGFGLVMVGLIVSLSKTQVISKNYMGFDYGESFDMEFKENNLYLLKNQQYFMDDYIITYTGREQQGNDYYYTVNYKRINPQTGALIEEFDLEPHLLNHPDMGIVANPSTKHYFHRDIFTHVTSIPMSKDKTPLELPEVAFHEITRQDSFFTSRGIVKFENMQTVSSEESDAAVIARLRIETPKQVFHAEPMFAIRNNQIVTEPAEIPELNLQIELTNIDPQTGKFRFKVVDDNDWLILKAIVFPYINILWIGITICTIGFFMAMYARIREYDKIKKREVA